MSSEEKLKNTLDSITSSQTNTGINAALEYVLYQAKLAVPSTTFHEDSVQIINAASKAKYELDSKLNHSILIARITSQLILAVQEYFDEEVIPCTEWPNPRDVVQFMENWVNERNKI